MNRILIIFLLLPLVLLGQNKTDLEPFIEVMKYESVMTSIKSYSINDGKVSLINFKDFPQVMDLYLKDGNHKFDKNITMIKMHKEKILEYCDRNIGVMNFDLPDSISLFNRLPFGFASFNHTPIFYQSAMLYDKNLNTVRLSGGERLELVAKNVVVPFLDNFKPLLDITEVKSFGLIYSYIAKDFTDNYATPYGETIVIVVPKEILNKYFNLEITSDEVILSSVFYGNTERGDLKKISIK